MEERKLDARESMELISRMIQNTRNRLENHAGRPFLVWGYTTVGIALLGQLAQDVAHRRVSATTAEAQRAQALAAGLADASYWKGHALLEGIVEQRSGGRSAALAQALRERREALARRDLILERRAEGIRKKAPVAEIDAMHAKAQALLAQAQEITARIQRDWPRQAALEAPRGIDVAELQARLGSTGAALVDFVEGESHLRAYVVRPQHLAFVDLGARQAVQDAARIYRAVLRDPKRRPAEIVQAGRRLYDLVFAPILRALDPAVRDLILVPSSDLAGVPFEALVLPDAAERYLSTPLFEGIGS